MHKKHKCEYAHTLCGITNQSSLLFRFVEPIDLPGYLENRPQSSTSHHSEENESSQNNHHSSAEVSQTNTDVQSVEDGPLSFVEVFRMIQAGEEIPGLKKLDIKACNQLPTVSQMSRKSKPWEK